MARHLFAPTVVFLADEREEQCPFVSPFLCGTVVMSNGRNSSQELRQFEPTWLALTSRHAPPSRNFSKLRVAAPSARLLVLANSAPGDLDRWLYRGADVYASCDAPSDRLHPMLEASETLGAVVIDGAIVRSMRAERSDLLEAASLTDREMEVLQLVATGQSNSAIAETLVISEHTVEFHVRNIYSKAGVSTRLEAASYSRKLGL